MPSHEAERLLKIARRDLRMASRLLDPDIEEASWGWALQQTLEKTLKAWLGLLEQADVEVNELLPLRAFTTFAVQGRYDDDPEELNLDRTAWCLRAEALIEHVQNLLG
jgi:HEPN domain-containing protein